MMDAYLSKTMAHCSGQPYPDALLFLLSIASVPVQRDSFVCASLLRPPARDTARFTCLFVCNVLLASTARLSLSLSLSEPTVRLQFFVYAYSESPFTVKCLRYRAKWFRHRLVGEASSKRLHIETFPSLDRTSLRRKLQKQRICSQPYREKKSQLHTRFLQSCETRQTCITPLEKGYKRHNDFLDSKVPPSEQPAIEKGNFLGEYHKLQKSLTVKILWNM